MFEKSLPGTGGRSRWSFLVSLVTQAALIAGAVALSIASAPALAPPEWTRVLIAPPPPAGPPPPPPPTVAVRPTQVFEGFRQPREIPDQVAMITEAPQELTAVAGPTGPYVDGATGDPGSAGIIGGTGDFSPVAPPPPPEPEPEPEAEAPSGPVPVASTVQAARLIRRVEPVYSRIAIETRTQGTVRLHAVISPEGTIERLQVLSGHPLLIPAAVQAVKQWRYRPTLLGSKAVPVETQIDVVFKLR